MSHSRPFRARAALLLALLVLAITPTGWDTESSAADRPAPGITWLDYDAGLARANKEKKFVLLDFYTTWCGDCKKMDKTTLADPDVIKAVGDKFVAVKVDGDKRADLASKHGAFAYPTFCVVGPDGGKVFQYLGYLSKPDFLTMLEYASSGAYKKAGFKEYCKSRKK